MKYVHARMTLQNEYDKKPVEFTKSNARTRASHISSWQPRVGQRACIMPARHCHVLDT